MSNSSPIAVVISPDRDLQNQLETALGKGSVAEAVWAVACYPELRDLERLKDAQPGCVLFLDFSDPIRARRIATELDRAYPFVAVIAIHSSETQEELRALMQLGIREVIKIPVSESEVALSFIRAAKKMKPAEAGGGRIYAFVPAKPGAGATTVAISTAAAVARISNLDTLLLDFDLRLGVTSFVLRLDGRYSVQDALNEAVHLDGELWSQLVTRRGHLEILGSAPVEVPSDPLPDAYMAVLNCAQARYATICVDLPGTMERYELEVLDRAKEIFLVCTPDVTGLHMAKRKAEALQKLNFAEKVSAVVNHADRRSVLPVADIEKLMQAPIRFILPSDPKSVAAAVQLGEAIQSKSALGGQVEAIAKSIVGTAVGEAPAGSVRRFIEFFSVSPTREHDFWKR